MRAISQLKGCEQKLDRWIPNSIIQTKLDALGCMIEAKFAPLTAFNEWLEKNNAKSWYHNLALFLVKLPIKAVRNIVRMLYSIIKSLCYAAVHPLKTPIRIAKMLVRLLHELTKPDTWARLGAQVAGASAGHAILSLNPYALIGVGIGAAISTIGLTAGAIKTAIDHEGTIKNYLLTQLASLPEAALTGFFIGLATGSIHRLIYKSPSPFVDRPSCLDGCDGGSSRIRDVCGSG